MISEHITEKNYEIVSERNNLLVTLKCKDGYGFENGDTSPTRDIKCIDSVWKYDSKEVACKNDHDFVKDHDDIYGCIRFHLYSLLLFYLFS